jgi:hypothetical protein
MGIADFLFEGQVPENVTTGTKTVNDLPDWYQSYTKGLIGKANAIAAEGYQPYVGGARISSFTPNQRRAFEMTENAVGAYKPDLNQARAFTQSAGTESSLAQASPYFEQSAMRVPQGISSYMNPYTNQVVDRIGALSQRQLKENILPTIQNQFIAGGTFGGSRSGEAVGRAVRDLGESTMAQQSQALQQGYGQAAQLMQADQARLAQLGQISGALTQADLTRRLQAGEQLGRVGALEQSLGLSGAAALESVGTTQQQQAQKNLDLAYQDFLQQRDYDREQIGFLNNVIRGIQLPTRQYQERYGPAEVYQPSPLSQIAQGAATVLGLTNMGRDRNR